MSIDEKSVEPFKDLFTRREFRDILNLGESELLQAVSHRKGPDQEVRNMCREINEHGRGLYSRFIKNVGRNIYPVIVATDHEPEFSGVGSTFTLFLENGMSIVSNTHTHTHLAAA